MKAVRVLKRDLESLLSRGAIEPRDVVNIMSKTRTVLENNGRLKDKCPQVSLFSNWCVHGKLTRSTVMQNILLKISKVITSELGNEDSGAISDTHTNT